MTFTKVNPKQSFPELEEQILKFWQENKIFEKSVENRENSEEFCFFDGPPFATGTPHYGHILAGTIKDVVPRYQTMKGKKVERKFGWDTHGLPIENIVEKKLEISGKEQIEEVGIFKFNEICRENVLTYVNEWRKIVERMGRWVDMDNDYKTMDTDFMESVWWVFKTIYDKGLIYEGNRIVPYCPRCSTPLANFEVNQGYKDKQDKSITIKFKLKTDNFKEGVGIIVKNEDGKILLGKRKKTGLLTKPGGMVDAGETPLEAAIRELEEETGIYTENLELFSNKYNVDPKRGIEVKNYVYIVNVKNDIKLINNEPDKFEFWNFYDIDKINDNEIESYQVDEIEQLKGNKEIPKAFEPKEKFFLAWTTTPWTLMSNLGLAVGEDVEYSEIKDLKSGEIYILATERLKDYYKSEEEFEVLASYKGTRLEGMKYEPIYKDFYKQLVEENKDLGNNVKFGENAYSVVLGHHVDTSTGTGIVHIAPAYGEDDFIIGKKFDLGFVQHIDGVGKVVNTLKDNGKYVFDYNEEVISELKQRGIIIKIATIDHSYPHCRRCNTPLIYRGISAWYVAVEKFRDQMVANNEKITWVPENIKYGRFGNWLKNAIDWNISRNRYWGSAIPVWQSEDKKEEICVGSIEELYNLNKDFGQITKVILLRHRESEKNVLGIEDCSNKYDLTEKGLTDAENLVEILQKENIDVIFSSPFKRCLSTINPLAKKIGKEVIIDDRLKEINVRKLDGQKSNWEDKFNNVKIGETGESQIDCYNRMKEFLIETIENHKGKTIVICSHGDPLLHIKKVIKDFDFDNVEVRNKIYPSKEGYEVKYIYTKQNVEVDLHKHFVDEIFIANKKSFKAKKVLGVHGWTSRGIKNDTWPFIKQALGKDGITLDVPDFDSREETSYKIWKEKLEKIDIKSYDTIIAHSFGCPVIMQYLTENNLKTKRLVLVAPSGLKGNEYLEKIISEFNYDIKNIKNYCNELVVISSKDDNVASANHEYSKFFAKEAGVNLIVVDGFQHTFKNTTGGNLLAGLVKYGTPLKRVPEVLDCWFESGSMPYASKHYPFADKKNGVCISKGVGLSDQAKSPSDTIILQSILKVKKKIKFHGKIIGTITTQIGNITFNSDNILKHFHTKHVKEFHYRRGLLALVFKQIDEIEFKNNIGYFAFKNMIVKVILGEQNNGNYFLKTYYVDNKLTEKYNLQNTSVLKNTTFKIPADFIAEGLDQTRGWFYTLLILGTALFNDTPFSNVIVNGIVLAEDGKKMSKSLQNYPAPELIFEKYGADAMRFYLMNSPVVEAQDLRFAESGVEEIVKKVILPLWNTYYFFVTYANIDGFEGLADDNKQMISDDKKSNKMTIQIKKSINDVFEFTTNPDKTHLWISSITEEKATEFPPKVGTEYRNYNNGVWSNYKVIEFKENELFTLQSLNSPYRVRYTYTKINENLTELEYFEWVESGEITPFGYGNLKKLKQLIENKLLSNNLDKWLVSELNELIKEVTEGFDNYKLDVATKPIIKFMDNLTNWYIRRSRKRFWKSENDSDKQEAYETLYFVLVELTKIIAPLMPFVSEYIFKELTGKKSVHLEDFPAYNPNLIDEKLNADTDKAQKIITLGLAWRANNKIRVRQPLNSITITEELDNYYKEIIKEELNVKEILVVSGDKLAKKICKPNGRNIGPKFGKDVKFIMEQAKAGNFEELPNGNAKVGGFELEAGDFEIEYLAEDKDAKIESGFGMVIAMDDTITEDLKLEGYARDLVRHIQEARKEAGFEVDDRIEVEISEKKSLEESKKVLKKVLEKFKNYIENETLSSVVDELKNVDLEKEVEIEELKVSIKLIIS